MLPQFYKLIKLTRYFQHIFVKCQYFDEMNHIGTSFLRSGQVDKLLDMQRLDSYHAGTSSGSA